MRIRILGPLHVDDDGRGLAITAGQQRTLLAVLALEAGRTVSTERLVDEIWAADVPPRAVLTVQGYVFRLRRVLGPGVLLTRRHGYELTVPSEFVDAHLFDQLYAQGWRELARGAWDSAIRTLTQALALWRGPALADVPAGTAIAAAAARLNQARAQAVEARLMALKKRAAPAQLPPDVARFAGREADLHRLDTLAQQDMRPTIVISAVGGAAGIGKTALAVRWAYQQRHRFPDGQLFVNLRGYASGPPVQPLDALTRFLRALGLPEDEIPLQLDEAAQLYRGLLADRSCLVVLDNAADAAQVRPLLPTGPGNLVLVTSRDNLMGLVASNGAATMSLDTLTPADAQILLSRVLDRARLQAEPQAASELAALCGYLPLPLCIVAADLAARPTAGIGYLTARLRQESLVTAEVPHDGLAGVRAALDLSYRALPDQARRLFRWLGLPATQDFSVSATAALAGIDEPSATAILRRLAAAGLVDEQHDGRYAMHDLVRAYAAERLTVTQTAAEKSTAIWRLHSFYLARVDAAARLIHPRHQVASGGGTAARLTR